MTPKGPHARPILVTGAAGAVGSIGRNLTEMLLAKGHKVRAMVRREDERASIIPRTIPKSEPSGSCQAGKAGRKPAFGWARY